MKPPSDSPAAASSQAPSAEPAAAAAPPGASVPPLRPEGAVAGVPACCCEGVRKLRIRPLCCLVLPGVLP